MTHNPDSILIYPVHLNPIVREIAYSILSDQEGIFLLEPLDFADMVNLIARSYLVFSHTGGLQEESAVFSTREILLKSKR
ncbi:UDP-N-acetylglucosamine 2-epimerase [Paenibacillus aceti]|uniref:UDP-N-acetylglucosamine 2-epimerase domain-containing protein n=1 Tax=Paenibacillus aceti TaxID=1820010 RepID=A0ABQ1WA80_9BACL|nr:hypothetical protein GCM10010913_46390 [Paenibacillus aceti]